MSQSPQKQLLARMSGIGKRFGRVPVLSDVALDIYAGEVHVLAGENGAGKSTLIKILGGVHQNWEGTIEIGGRPVRPASPLDAVRLGVSVIFQELSLVPTMSVADNVFLGRHRTRYGLVRKRVQRAEAARILRQLGLSLDVDRAAGAYPIAVRQLIEVAKALSQDARILVMDEPTSALNAPEAERLFLLIDQLRQQGRGIVYITHKMEEIGRLADRITVLRDGRLIGTASAAELPPAKLIRWMVGRDMDNQFPRHAPRPGAERLRLRQVRVFSGSDRGKEKVEPIDLVVHAGEIVGLAGLRGAGNSALLMGLFGAYGRRTQGDILLDGQVVRFRSPVEAVRHGLALVTNDRKGTGLIPSMSVIANTVLADLPRLSPYGWRRPRLERERAEFHARALGLRAPSLAANVDELSGGNQQKVVLAKWLQTDPKVLLLDEPTRGVDVGAKWEVYRLMNEWTAQGIAILLITSEMPELLAMSDRIVVLHRGRVTARFTRDRFSPDRILEAAMGRVFDT